MGVPGNRARLAALGSAFLTILGPAAVRADGFALRFEPGYDTESATTTDSAGQRSHRETTSYSQRTNLNVDTRLFPLFRLLGQGYYESGLSLGNQDGVQSELATSRWNVTGQAAIGDPVLNARLTYDRSQRSQDSLSGGVVSRGSELIRQTLMAYGVWRAPGLPWVALRLSRTEQYDELRRSSDVTIDDIGANASYQASTWDARYRFAWQRPVDHLTGTETTSVTNGGRLQYTDRFIDDRLSLYGAYDLVHRSARTTAIRTGGTVLTQQFPVQGLSAVETFPATPVRVALVLNAALVDGETGVGAGLNLGFGPSLSGDTDFRDAGTQLADAITPVNMVYLWVDRPLSPAVAGSFSFAAYRSDNNLDWTPIPIGGAVVFAAFQNRFEIPIAETQARYLKVTARPLSGAVTTDSRYRDILVTEVQLFRIQGAADVAGRAENLRGNAGASARLQIVRGGLLSFDTSASLTHESAPSRPTRTTWTLSNGLSSSLLLARGLSLDARLERTELDPGTGRESVARFSASLGAQPIPAAGANLTYNAQIHDAPAGREVGNLVSLFTRADLYRGVGVSASASAGFTDFPGDKTGRDLNAQAGAALAPNPWVGLTASYGYTRSRQSGGGASNLRTEQARLDTTLTVTPAPAASAVGGWSRVWAEQVYDLFNVTLNVAPFPGGDLYLAFVYNETADSRQDQRLRQYGPAVRWKIKGANYLSAAYTVVDQTSKAQDLHSQAFTARLTLMLP